MECDNCRTDGIAYTLTTHVAGAGDSQVELHFCSTECLRVWT